LRQIQESSTSLKPLSRLSDTPHTEVRLSRFAMATRTLYKREQGWSETTRAQVQAHGGACGVCARVRCAEHVALLPHPNRFQPPGLRSQRSPDNLLRPKPGHVQSKMSSWHSYRLEPTL